MLLISRCACRFLIAVSSLVRLTAVDNRFPVASNRSSCSWRQSSSRITLWLHDACNVRFSVCNCRLQSFKSARSFVDFTRMYDLFDTWTWFCMAYRVIAGSYPECDGHGSSTLHDMRNLCKTGASPTTAETLTDANSLLLYVMTTS